jgi:hypothetical protein
MGVVIEICIKYPGGRTRIRVTDMQVRIKECSLKVGGGVVQYNKE